MAWVEKHGPGFRVRYRMADGSLGTETGFNDITSARNRAKDIESEKRNGRFVDPRAGQTRLAEWVEVWSDAHDVSPGTWAKYQSHLRNHILPRFGDDAVADISRMAVKAWVKALRRKLAEPTVADVVTLLSQLLGEAVDENLITANPCRKLRLNSGDQPERPHARPWQVVRLGERCGDNERVLIVTAAYTGLRWGELAGLRWPNLHLGHGVIKVDAKTGALHEIGGRLELGPPKSPASVRTVHLPEFLIKLLLEHRADTDHEHVFTGIDGGLMRRTNFRRRVWLLAVDGNKRRGWAPLFPGLHFHDLRHTHKTWMIEDGVPEVVQCRRLGHRMDGVRGRYSHVTQAMTDHLLDGMQRRWERSDGDLYPENSETL